jgi:2,4-dienoyl-CoA reductase-like NADH-dependent reductase (Old Yellow Enzyme family)
MTSGPTHLFTPLVIREIALRNRIVVSPMCQYSGRDGFANDWHLVHLGALAAGGAGLVLSEAIAVTPEGRITPADLGLWHDEQTESLARTVSFIDGQGAVAGVQLAHAGRKASTSPPWLGRGPVDVNAGGWRPVLAPSPVPFSDSSIVPTELDVVGITRVVQAFAEAARRSREIGFKVIELHAAHGYLMHQFLSPLSNRRIDGYGGSFENRIRLVVQVVDAVRTVWPERLPLWLRVSATDWVEDGWTVEETVELARIVAGRGVDLVDCSAGGLVPDAPIPVGPGYQVPFAERVRREAGVLTGAVGMITSPAQADTIVRSGQADAVILGRELLRDPHWPLRAAHELRHETHWPNQYLQARFT